MTVALSRLERLERAWRDALAAADPEILIYPQWLPAVRRVMPDVTLTEITEMLNWRVRKLERESEEWMRKIRELNK